MGGDKLLCHKLPYGAKFLRSTSFTDFVGGFSTTKIALCETWLYRLIIHIFIGSTPFGAVVWLCLQLCSPETFYLPRSLPQTWRWSACRANGKIPQSRRGSCTQSSQTYKDWDSKVSSRAWDSFNHPLFCKEEKQRSHVLVDMVAAHHDSTRNHSVAISTRSLHDPPLRTSELTWHLIHTNLSPNEIKLGSSCNPR